MKICGWVKWRDGRARFKALAWKANDGNTSVSSNLTPSGPTLKYRGKNYERY